MRRFRFLLAYPVVTIVENVKHVLSDHVPSFGEASITVDPCNHMESLAGTTA